MKHDTNGNADFSFVPLRCPVCGLPLQLLPGEACCGHNHRFDRAKQGYFNLLLSQSSGLGHHGDDRLMLTERRSFLEKGYYLPMGRRMAELAAAYFPVPGVRCSDENPDSRSVGPERTAPDGAGSEAGYGHCSFGSDAGCEHSSSFSASPESGSFPLILDCGCGEGYYSRELYTSLESAGIPVSMLCLDISKEAAKLTARRCFPHATVVASAYELPVLTGSCSMIVDIFAPVAEKEFYRALAPDGILIRVVPQEKHLWELKQAVYDRPYENPPVDPELEGFTFLYRENIDYTIELDTAEDIRSLFKMTPYYYKTSRADQSKLEALQSLATRLSFAILVSRRKNG